MVNTMRTQVSFAEVEAWACGGYLPEMKPSRQKRSASTAAALIEAGRRLLHDRSLEDLSIEAICADAKTTVGAFYGRFENKQHFFLTLQRVQTMRTEQSIREFVARHPPDASSIDALCRDIVDEAIGNFRSNLGVMRASLQHSKEGMWEVIKKSGDRYRVMLVDLIGPYLSSVPLDQRRLRILFAYQALAGVLVHAVLNNPGPLALEDDQIRDELVRLMKAYLIAP
ncbi:TetR/AcrR family transcriptional regulator [Variovorax sp. LjRoot130]|uniref:TetR/AcrR family transcriptional regulator n=1 Tax=Variovorax sp. LjRoot130 TaxID=3342261 RepID=UPI003ED06864